MDVDGISVAAAEALEGQLIDKAEINDAGHLIFTRKNLTTIDAGLVKPPPIASWPVGSIYLTVNSANPGTYLGNGTYGGTWTPWGAGRVPVGVLGSDADFNTPEKTGGEKAVTLTAAQMPWHQHTGTTATESANHSHSGSTAGEGGHAHNFGMSSKYWTDVSRGGQTTLISQVNGTPPGAAGNIGNAIIGVTNTDGNHGHAFSTGTESAAHAHTFTTDAAGGGGSHNNMSPYITCYMWKRLPDPPT